jgi:very-short-patch-repair endonuclease
MVITVANRKGKTLDLNRLKELYSDRTLTLKEISAQLGFSRVFIRLQLQKMGVPLRPAPSRKGKKRQLSEKSKRSSEKRRKDKLIDFELVEELYYNQKKSLREIAEIYGIARVSLGRILRRRGYKLREINEWRRGRPPWNKGRKCTPEEVEQCRLAGAQGLLVQQKGYGTSIELKTDAFLKEIRLDYHHQYLVNNKFLVDFYIPSLNMIIECDGDYWHSRPEVVKRDNAKNAYIPKCGYHLLRISETNINNGRFKDIILDQISKIRCNSN